MQIVVDGLLTHYELQGEGKLILLLHGWGDNIKGLTGLRTALATDYQVLSIDLPGFGATQVPPATWDLQNYAKFVSQALKKLALHQPYAIIGHSNGGALAVLAVGRQALQPEKLILLAASGIRNKSNGRLFLLHAIAKIGNAATFWLPNKSRQGLRAALYNSAKSDMLVVPELEETFKKTVRQDVQADAAKIRIPTLLLFAKNDDAVPIADAYTYQGLIPDSQLTVVESAGHFLHIDQPATVETAIKEFLKA